MFQTLRMRLLVLYVFVAVTLVFIVGATITTFALWTFAAATNDAVAEVAREAPEIARHALADRRTLKRASFRIIRQLARPGLKISVLAVRSGSFSRLASTEPDGMPPGGDRGSAPPPPSSDTGIPDMHGHDGMADHSQFPFRLNVLLGLHRKRVDIPGGMIVISPDPHPLEKIINAFLVATLPVGVFVAILAFLLGRYITGQALRPLMETTQSLRSFAAGDFSPRPIAAAGHNEIGELVTAYNGAAAQVSSAFEERRKAEQEMRQFIADAGHELRTPLTVIMGFIDVLRRRTASDPAMTLRIYDMMQVESRRMKVLVEKLIVLARLENPQESIAETVDFGDMAKRLVTSLSSLQAIPHVALHAETGVFVLGNANELYDALGNLIENALKYAPKSPVEVNVRAEGGLAIAEVTDHGPGLAADEQQHIFDRFYRGQSRGETEGFGLGLAITKRVIERAGGEITLVSAPGEGCRFTIRLPLVPAGREAAIPT